MAVRLKKVMSDPLKTSAAIPPSSYLLLAACVIGALGVRLAIAPSYGWGGFEGDLLVTQGDNNAEIDPWNPAVGDVIGRRRVLIPGIGTLIAFLVQPAVLASLAAGLSTAWIVARGEDDEDDDTNHPDDGEPRAVTTTDAPHRPDPVTV